MKRNFQLLLIALYFCGCSFDNSADENDVPRDATFKIYCTESLMADVLAWSIQFEEGEAVAEGAIYSLPDPAASDVVPLSDQTSMNVGLPLGLAAANGGLSLPYGTYVGVREGDGVEIYISISELNELNTDSSDRRWYNGTTLVNGIQKSIICYDSE